MTTINISLPEEVKAFIEAKMVMEGYTSVNESINVVVAEERLRGMARG